ncbi:murein L,D-transpeptidase catalytic domain family protein [Pontibacter liquoris]|uniref:murein L,D-transpeptidase catalytic domain family protein n=1 Tax=Pontibacter liquoris TaxID=2905677 RepID=UPI001FA78BF9|nr:murein L,D-transpeptidase catalytic domain family protein [Pontibacter liquoris]
MIRAVLTTLTLALLSFASLEVPVTGAQALGKEVHTVARTTNALTFTEKKMAFDDHALDVYNEAGLKTAGLSYEVFEKAFVGYHNFKQRQLIAPSNSVLTVIDFTQASNQKRLWIIDVNTKKLLYNTLVAHGRNTGEADARQFSNEPNSFKSSIGFYLTGKTYTGKHGLSLRLNGMDPKYNSNAMQRAIVVHGADYVSENFVKQYGRLGRSLGCPAVPLEFSKAIINTIKDNSCLYINGADQNYMSSFLDNTQAVETFALSELSPVQQI